MQLNWRGTAREENLPRNYRLFYFRMGQKEISGSLLGGEYLTPVL